jgi:hypothetical protein
MNRHSENLQSEKSIVWVKGKAGDYPFLRESEHLCHFRERFPVKSLRYDVIAYATLSENSGKAWGRGGCPQSRRRRFWYLRETDLKHYGTTDCPVEAVEPSSISAGQASVPRWEMLKKAAH